MGGVYLRLFISSPAWALRKPKEFLSELMDTTLTLMSKEKTDVSIRHYKTVYSAVQRMKIYHRNIYFMRLYFPHLIYFLDGYVGINDAGSRVFTSSAAYFGGPSAILGSHTTTLSTDGCSEQSAIGI